MTENKKTLSLGGKGTLSLKGVPGQQVITQTLARGQSRGVPRGLRVDHTERAVDHERHRTARGSCDDELVVEAPIDDAQAMSEVVVSEMENAMKLRVPLKVDAGIGPNWFDVK